MIFSLLEKAGNCVHGLVLEITTHIDTIKNDSTAVERTLNIAQDVFKLYYNHTLPASTERLCRDLQGISVVVSGIQVIQPVNHFFRTQAWKTATVANNVFNAGILVLSYIDMKELLKNANIADLGQYGVDLGSKFPLLAPIASIPLNAFVSATLIVTFVAHAKEAFDKIIDTKTHGYERKAKMFELAYAMGQIGLTSVTLVVALNPTTFVALHLAKESVGLFGTLVYGAYNT